jgi:hypothetical protein
MTHHGPITRDLGIKLDRLEQFATVVEETLSSKATAFDAEVSAGAASLDHEVRQDYFEYHAEEFAELSDELPTVLRYAVLAAADTALETYLNNTCQTYAEVENAQVRLDDLTGRGIRRARSYLTKVAGIAVPGGSTWTNVIRLHELRNCVIHADGHVSTSLAELRAWSPSIAGLQITEWGQIRLAREFTSEALKAYRAFAEGVDDACSGLRLWLSVFPVEDAEATGA